MIRSPIVVMSAGRADTATTPRLLQAEGIPFYLAVPARDLAAYRRTFPDVDHIVVPLGLGPARAAVQALGIGSHWQLDDDLRAMRVRDGGRYVKAELGAGLGWAEWLAADLDLAHVGFELENYAWRDPRPYILNRHNRQLHWIRSDAAGTFWPYTFEDVDFALQLLTAGQRTARILRYAIRAPRMAADAHDPEAKAAALRRLVERWPEHVRLHRSPALFHVQWGRFGL